MWSSSRYPHFAIIVVMTVLTGLVYPARRHRHRAGRCSRRRRTGRCSTVNGKVVGSRADRPELHQARVLPPAAVGGRRRLRRAALERIELRSDEPEAHRPREGLGRAVPQGESGLHWADSGRRGDRVRQRARSAHQPGQRRRFRSRAWPRRAASSPTRCAALVAAVDRAAVARVHRRAARQRAAS